MHIRGKIEIMLAVLIIGLALVTSIALFYQVESTVNAMTSPPIEVAGGWCPNGCTNAVPIPTLSPE